MERCGQEPLEALGKGVAAVPPPLACAWPAEGTPPLPPLRAVGALLGPRDLLCRGDSSV